MIISVWLIYGQLVVSNQDYSWVDGAKLIAKLKIEWRFA